TDALAPAATDAHSTAGLPETAAADAPSTPPESPGGPPAGVEPKGARPESPGGPPAAAIDLSQDPTGMVEHPGEE
ncbi:MAG: hypothetical protein ABWZ36_03215, partial [Jiangellaceae bacterium]